MAEKAGFVVCKDSIHLPRLFLTPLLIQLWRQTTIKPSSYGCWEVRDYKRNQVLMSVDLLLLDEKILNKKAIEVAEQVRPVPELRTGDIVTIKLEVPENRRRLSIYKGIVISRQNAGIHTTIRIRRIIAVIGVEIVFPIIC